MALIAACLAMFCLAGGARAADPVSPAAGIATSTDTPLKKVGEARLRVMLWSIYDSRLYTSDGAYREGSRPLRLEIQYLRDIRSDALISRTGEEWEAMGRQHPRQSEWLSRLNTLWPDIKESDVLSLEIDENNVSTFLHNGEPLGLIDDPEFGQQFIDIWLSEDCTRPAIREALLGATEAN